MTVSVHPEADAEFAAAVDWYELQRIGPGDEFEQDVFDAFDLIAECPHAWSKWPGLDAVHVFPLDRFPFLLPYFVRDEAVVILTLAHAKRRPGYWRSRLPEK